MTCDPDDMPRDRRRVYPGIPYHATNRRVERRRLFRNASDYRHFLRLLKKGKERHPVSVYALCLMPNHFHALVRPAQTGALSAYFHWVLGCYSRHIRTCTHTSGAGHVFQQRFWTGPIEDDRHFLSVLRYIERNPLTAKLVKRAEHWPWSSLRLRQTGGLDLLDAIPVALPSDWLAQVNDDPLAEDPD